MEAYLSDAFLDRVRRAYCFALDAGARTRGRTWRSIDARRRDVHAALLADGNAKLREIFIDPTATDLYFGVEYLCRSMIGTLAGDSFSELALAGGRATRGQYQATQLREGLSLIGGASVVEIGPGVGYCAFHAHSRGIEDYSTIDLPLGLVAQARFLGEMLGPAKIWMDGEAAPGHNQIKLFSVARLPERAFDIALNVDSVTEMSLNTALDYMAWINHHAQLFISMNHEVNPFTVAEIARHRIAGKRIMRSALPDWPGYFQERFLIDPQIATSKQVWWLRVKTLFWSVAVPIRWRVRLLRPTIVPG